MRHLPDIDPKWTKQFGDEGVTDAKPRYMGIDASLSAFGLVVVTEDQHYGALIKVPPTLPFGARLLAIQSIVGIYLHMAQPELIAIERRAFAGAASGTSAWLLGGLNAALAMELWQLEMDDRVVDLAPNTVKKFVTNNGNAKKNTMMREVYKVWDFEALDDNCADAYGLAQAAMTIATGTAKYAWQLAALKKQIDAYGSGPSRAERPEQPRNERRVIRRRPR